MRVKKFPLLLSQKTSWIVLLLLFTFDDVFSYFAVTRMGGHEANKLIAFAVEKYPLLYALCLPARKSWFDLILIRAGISGNKIVLTFHK